MTDTPNRLTAILSSLIDAARHNPGASFVYTLNRGLSLHAAIKKGRFSLGISRRAPHQPSLKEYQTVLAHLPRPLPENGEPELKSSNGRWYLIGTWPVEELASQEESA